MTTSLQSFADLSDGDLLATVHRLAIDERRATASLIASLAELDERRLYLAEGYSSLFTYCRDVLGLSERTFKHAKAFVDSRSLTQKGLADYVSQVRGGTFPEERNSFGESFALSRRCARRKRELSH